MTFAAPHAAATTPPPPLHSDHARQQLHRITASLPAEQRAEIRAKIRALAADAYQTGYVAGYEDGRDDGLPPIPAGPTPRGGITSTDPRLTTTNLASAPVVDTPPAHT